MIQTITQADFKKFWPSFKAVIKAQETYAFEPDMSFEQAYQLWCESPIKTFVYKQADQVLGSYFIKANGMGPSDHVCNCGYMVTAAARGQGIARKLCEHSQQQAIELGFRVMQFNAVVATNVVAVQLWQKLGFEIVGTIPQAYRHGRLGLVDCYIMHKQLSL